MAASPRSDAWYKKHLSTAVFFHIHHHLSLQLSISYTSFGSTYTIMDENTHSQTQTPTLAGNGDLPSNNPPPTANSEFEPKESLGGIDPSLQGVSPRTGLCFSRNVTHDKYRVDKAQTGDQDTLTRQRKGHPEDRLDPELVPNDTEWFLRRPAPFSADGYLVSCPHVIHPVEIPGPSIFGMRMLLPNPDATEYSVCTFAPEEVERILSQEISLGSRDAPETSEAPEIPSKWPRERRTRRGRSGEEDEE
jgi:hypothetical protein